MLKIYYSLGQWSIQHQNDDSLTVFVSNEFTAGINKFSNRPSKLFNAYPV